MPLRCALLTALLVLACAGTAFAADDPVTASLDRAQASGAVGPDALAGYRDTYARALAARRRLSPRDRRGKELRAVIGSTRAIAAGGRLTLARLPSVFLTLRRNTEWWLRSGPPGAGSPGEQGAKGRTCRAGTAVARAARVRFPGSRLVWQYYPGAGLQLQVNATFSFGSALYNREDASGDAALRELLDELVPLAVERDGFVTWEYLFGFGGGEPPWTSALSQGSAVKLLARAGERFDRADLIVLAQKAARAFAVRTPRGLAVPLRGHGTWFALYGFAPRLRVLNAHLQATIALDELRRVAPEPVVAGLREAGLRAARRKIRGFDTGDWSKYANPGRPADLNYHVLNRDLARELCRRTGERAVCGAWRRFTTYLTRRCPRTGGRT